MALYKIGTGTLGRACGDLGLRDARRGTWDGDAGRQIQGHGGVNDYCKSRRSMQNLFLHENVLFMVNIRFQGPEPHGTPYDV